MKNLNSMSEPPTKEDQVCIYEDDVLVMVVRYRPDVDEVTSLFAKHVFTWDTFIGKKASGWRYLNETVKAENACGQLEAENARLRVFAKLVFAHLYGNITEDVCAWRGDHLSKTNIELIEEIKEKL